VVIELRIPARDAAALAVALGGFAQLGLRLELNARESGDWITAVVPNDQPSLNAALGVLQSVSALQLARAKHAGVRMPYLYESGVRYVREPRGREWWQTVADNLYMLEGDCEDLATHRAAELNVYTGEPARAETIRTGPRTFHAIVVRANGQIEDPSAKLGMTRSRRWRN
jgi:hypothetical protein